MCPVKGQHQNLPFHQKHQLHPSPKQKRGNIRGYKTCKASWLIQDHKQTSKSHRHDQSKQNHSLRCFHKSIRRKTSPPQTIWVIVVIFLNLYISVSWSISTVKHLHQSSDIWDLIHADTQKHFYLFPINDSIYSTSQRCVLVAICFSGASIFLPADAPEVCQCLRSAMWVVSDTKHSGHATASHTFFSFSLKQRMCNSPPMNRVGFSQALLSWVPSLHLSGLRGLLSLQLSCDSFCSPPLLCGRKQEVSSDTKHSIVTSPFMSGPSSGSGNPVLLWSKPCCQQYMRKHSNPNPTRFTTASDQVLIDSWAEVGNLQQGSTVISDLIIES